MDAYGFDAVGRFTNYFETGLERVVWAIVDERKGGHSALIEYQEGDKITLLDERGIRITDTIILDANNAEWADYFGMCALLGIDPKDDFKYYIGLAKGRKD